MPRSRNAPRSSRPQHSIDWETSTPSAQPNSSQIDQGPFQNSLLLRRACFFARSFDKMATPIPTDDVVIKLTTSDPASEEQAVLQDHEPSPEEGPALSPLSTQEQLQAMARRREAAVSFKNQVGECRLALRYSVIGWTGTLDPVSSGHTAFSSFLPARFLIKRNAIPLPSCRPPTYPPTRPKDDNRLTYTDQNPPPQDKISTALSNAPSIEKLDEEMNELERKLAPFLPADNNSASGGQGLGPEALARVERVREELLAIEPGVKSTRFIKPVLDGVELDARAEGLLPPQDSMGWVWSLPFDDWFIWRAGEGAFVSARQGLRTDFVAA